MVQLKMAAAELIQGCYDNHLKQVTQIIKNTADLDKFLNDKIETATLELKVDGEPANTSGTNVDSGTHRPPVQLSDYITALNVACYRSNFTIVSQLLRAGAQTDIRDSSGRLPVHWACLSAHDALAKVKALAQIDTQVLASRDNNDKTPLMLATCAGKNDLVAWLLSCDLVSIDAVDKIGWSALHQAAYNGHVTLVSTLLNYDADPNLQEARGDTALHVAAEQGDLSTVKALTAFLSCDLAIRNKDNETARDRAAAKPYGDCAATASAKQHDYDAVVAYLEEFDSTPTQVVLAHVTNLQQHLERVSCESAQLTDALSARCQQLEQQVRVMEERIAELEGARAEDQPDATVAPPPASVVSAAEVREGADDGVSPSVTSPSGLAVMSGHSSLQSTKELNLQSGLSGGITGFLARDEQFRLAQYRSMDKKDIKRKHQAEAILKNALLIIESLKCDDHLYTMYDHKALTFSQLQVVKAETTDRKKMEKLLHILLAKSNNEWAPVLLDSFRHSPAASKVLAKIEASL